MPKSSKKPAFQQLKEDILSRIADGTYQKDMRLPSERQFGEQWGISRMTVRRALDELVLAEILYRTRGSGTYIAQKKIQQQDIMSFSDMARMRGMEPTTLLLEKNYIRDAAVAESLGVPAQTELLKLRRLRQADGSPIGIEQVYIPVDYCPDLGEQDLTGSLYSILMERYGYRIHQQELKITAVTADKEERDLLRLQKGAPVLHIEGPSISTDGKALLYEQTTYCGNSFLLEVGITKRNS